jgi:biopolymer transport protein ExbD
MRFYSHKRRQPPAIIIVALIDVLIVLLIFLMVTTTFKQQSAMKLALPESSQGEKTGASEDAPLVVSIEKTGNLRLGASTDAMPLTIENLRSELLSRVAKNPELKVAINADTDAPFGKIVKVTDVVKDAKVKSLSAYIKEAPKQ